MRINGFWVYILLGIGFAPLAYYFLYRVVRASLRHGVRDALQNMDFFSARPSAPATAPKVQPKPTFSQEPKETSKPITRPGSGQPKPQPVATVAELADRMEKAESFAQAHALLQENATLLSEEQYNRVEEEITRQKEARHPFTIPTRAGWKRVIDMLR